MATTKTRPDEPPSETATRRPPDPTAAELALAQAGTAGTATASELDRPTLEPPSTAAGAMASATAGWITNKHVLMLWQALGPMDAWAYYDGGIGWKRSTQAGDVAARGMGLLTSGARLGGGTVHIYEGAGGDVDAMYLW